MEPLVIDFDNLEDFLAIAVQLGATFVDRQDENVDILFIPLSGESQHFPLVYTHHFYRDDKNTPTWTFGFSGKVIEATLEHAGRIIL